MNARNSMLRVLLRLVGHVTRQLGGLVLLCSVGSFSGFLILIKEGVVVLPLSELCLLPGDHTLDWTFSYLLSM